MRCLMLSLILAAITATPVPGQGKVTAADSADIRRAALDYIEGYYDGDGARMERAVHPELAKRIVRTDPNGRSQFSQMSAMTLVQIARSGGGTSIPASDKRKDVTILDIYRGTASAKIDASGWVDYLHLARWNGRWVIVNVLWELHPDKP